MNKVFIDADIILDLLLTREPYFISSSKLFTLIEEKEVIAFTTPVILANIYYISAKMVKKGALESIRKLLTLLRVTAVDEKIMLLAANSDFKDFEDSIQYYAAKNEAVDFLITRNKIDYKITDLTVCTPDEYLSVYHKPSTN